jgi:hypothetical protein
VLTMRVFDGKATVMTALLPQITCLVGTRRTSSRMSRTTVKCHLHVEDEKNLRRAPWKLTFDLRERETLWTDENKARLVKTVARIELGLTSEEVDQRFWELTLLVPDIGTATKAAKCVIHRFSQRHLR